MRRRRQAAVFVVSSPSGGGKTTVIKQLMRRHPRLVRSVSVTTRLPRPDERRGRDYRFVSVRGFQELRKNRQLLEWAHVHEAFYGTPKKPITNALAKDRNVIVCVDVQGARQIKRTLKNKAVLVFLEPPSMKALRERLLQRKTETSKSLAIRLAAAKKELACRDWYDYAVVNDRVSDAVTRLEAIMIAHRLRVSGRQKRS